MSTKNSLNRPNRVLASKTHQHNCVHNNLVPMLIFLLPIVITGLVNVQLSGANPASRYDIGVKPGDWAKYNVSITWSSNDPNTKFYQEREIKNLVNTEWVKVEVKEVTGTNFTIQETTRFKNRTESHRILGGDVRIDAVGVYIIAENLSAGDIVVLESKNLLISDLALREFAGVNTEVIYSHFYSLIPFFGMEINMSRECYWDKETGFLCEMQQLNSYTSSPLFSTDYYYYTTTILISMKMIETSLWKPKFTSISCQWWLWTIVSLVVVMMTVYILRKKNILNESIRCQKLNKMINSEDRVSGFY